MIDGAILDYNNDVYNHYSSAKEAEAHLLPQYDEDSGIPEEALEKLKNFRVVIRRYSSQTETYIILETLGLLKDLPQSILDAIKNNVIQNYKFNIDKDIPVKFQITNEDTLSLLSYIYKCIIRYLIL